MEKKILLIDDTSDVGNEIIMHDSPEDREKRDMYREIYANGDFDKTGKMKKTA